MYQPRETEKNAAPAATETMPETMSKATPKAIPKGPYARSLARKRRRALREKAAANASAEQWRADNKAAIAAHNAFMEKHGVCADAFRGR